MRWRGARGRREVCAELTRAPAVLGVGDLHVENFGTWRDVEGRLIRGVAREWRKWCKAARDD